MIARKFPGWHPVVQLAEGAHDNELSPTERYKCAEVAAKYMAHQLQAIKHDGSMTQPVVLSLGADELRAMSEFVHARDKD